MIANQIILGDDFPKRLKNLGRNVLEQRIVLILAIAARVMCRAAQKMAHILRAARMSPGQHQVSAASTERCR